MAITDPEADIISSRVFSFVRGEMGFDIRGPDAETICTRPRRLWSVTLLSLRKTVIPLLPPVKRLSAANVGRVTRSSCSRRDGHCIDLVGLGACAMGLAGRL